MKKYDSLECAFELKEYAKEITGKEDPNFWRLAGIVLAYLSYDDMRGEKLYERTKEIYQKQDYDDETCRKLSEWVDKKGPKIQSRVS